MKKYKGILYIILILTLGLTLSACNNTEKNKYTSAYQNTKETSAINNNLTFYEIMKAPDYYQGQEITFKGRIMEVSQKDNSIIIKLAVNNKLENTVIACCENNDNMKDIKSGNIINIKGNFTGIIRYKDINNQGISIPGVWIDTIEVIK